MDRRARGRRIPPRPVDPRRRQPAAEALQLSLSAARRQGDRDRADRRVRRRLSQAHRRRRRSDHRRLLEPGPGRPGVVGRGRRANLLYRPRPLLSRRQPERRRRGDRAEPPDPEGSQRHQRDHQLVPRKALHPHARQWRRDLVLREERLGAPLLLPQGRHAAERDHVGQLAGAIGAGGR